MSFFVRVFDEGRTLIIRHLGPKLGLWYVTPENGGVCLDLFEGLRRTSPGGVTVNDTLSPESRSRPRVT